MDEESRKRLREAAVRQSSLRAFVLSALKSLQAFENDPRIDYIMQHFLNLIDSFEQRLGGVNIGETAAAGKQWGLLKAAAYRQLGKAGIRKKLDTSSSNKMTSMKGQKKKRFTQKPLPKRLSEIISMASAEKHDGLLTRSELVAFSKRTWPAETADGSWEKRSLKNMCKYMEQAGRSLSGEVLWRQCPKVANVELCMAGFRVVKMLYRKCGDRLRVNGPLRKTIAEAQNDLNAEAPNLDAARRGAGGVDILRKRGFKVKFELPDKRRKRRE